MPSSLGAIARGHLRARLESRAEAEAKTQRDLDNAIRLSQMEGFTLEDEETPPPVVPEPVIPGPPGSPVAQNAVMNAARGAWQTSAAGDQPDPAAIAPAMGGTKAAPPAPRNVLELGHLALGGQRKRIVMDPSQTTGGRKRTAEKENKGAFDRVNTDGALGAYDPGVDYRGEERKKLNQAEIKRELVASGVDEKDAHLLAEHHVDMEGRRTKTAAEKRAGERATISEETLAERRRHNRAMEGGAAKAKVGKVNIANVKGNAQRWATSGNTVDAIVQLIQKFYPSVPGGEAYGIATAAVARVEGDATETRLKKIQAAGEKTPTTSNRGINLGTEGTPRAATDAEVDAALDAAGGDSAKASKILRAKGLSN